jgi:hypothetical protein
MREVNTSLHGYVEQQRKHKHIITNRIRTTLGRYFPDMDQFVSNLKASHGIISGGFLLSMCDPTIEYDDIDIYVRERITYGASPSTDNTTPIDKHVYGLFRQEHKDDEFPKNVCVYRLAMDTGITRVKSTTVSSQVFQIIETSQWRDIKTMITETFDFSVLVNTWDGDKLEITDIRGITDRVIRLNRIYFNPMSRFKYRVAKYRHKGFEFLDLRQKDYPEI